MTTPTRPTSPEHISTDCDEYESMRTPDDDRYDDAVGIYMDQMDAYASSLEKLLEGARKELAEFAGIYVQKKDYDTLAARVVEMERALEAVMQGTCGAEWKQVIDAPGLGWFHIVKRALTQPLNEVKP